MRYKNLGVWMLAASFALSACGYSGLTDEERSQTLTAEAQKTAAEIAAQPTDTATFTAEPSVTLTRTATDLPTETATVTTTASPTASSTVIPSETPDVEGTIAVAVAETLSAQPTSIPSDTPAPTQVALLPVAYRQVTLSSLPFGLAIPTEWIVSEDNNEALIQSPYRDSGVVIQQGSQTELARLGLLGREADLTVAMQHISLIGQEAEVTTQDNIFLDNLGLPALRLVAVDSSTITLAYLLTLQADDYLLVVGYAPLYVAPQFEAQVMTPLMLSLDHTSVQPSTNQPESVIATTLPATEVTQAEPTIEQPTTEVAQVDPTVEASTPLPTTAPPTEEPQAEPTTEPVAVEPTVAPVESTEVAQSGDDGGLTSYNSRALQLTFSHPSDAIVEQQGPLVLINSPANENARVVFVRGTPDFLVQNEILTSAEDPTSALTDLVQESLGEDIPVETAEQFGSQTYFVDIDLPNVFARYYLVDFDTEWVFILTVAPKGDVDFQANFVDPILNSLVISPPVVIEQIADVEFPVAYTSQTTGLLTGVFEDTQVTETADTVTANFGTAQVNVYFGKPAELLERGLIGSDIGLISALKSIAETYGIADVEVNSERILRFDRSAFVEFEADGLKYVYIGAIWREPDDWMIVELAIDPAQYDEFNRTVFAPWVKQLDVDPDIHDAAASGESSESPTEESDTENGTEIQPTYTPLPTYTPQATYTQPAPGN